MEANGLNVPVLPQLQCHAHIQPWLHSHRYVSHFHSGQVKIQVPAPHSDFFNVLFRGPVKSGA